MQLTTDRLILRPPTLEDAPFVLKILNTPDFIANVGDRAVRELNTAENYIQERMLDHWEEHGFGSFLMIKKGEDLPFGTISLLRRDYTTHPDIGFAIFSEYYRQGYTYEGCVAIQEWAHEQGLHPLCGFCLPDNIASVSLLKKLGLKFVKEFNIPGDPNLLHLYSEQL